MRRFHIVFSNSETDKRLLEASISALSSEVLSARYGHTVIYDDSTKKTTLEWWRLPTGGWNAK